MNLVILKGNCGIDPRITDFENGGKVAQFSLATTKRAFKTRDGQEIPEKTTWHNIVVKKSGLASVCEQYVKKGTPLLITGELENRKYTDSYGTERIITEIIVDDMELLGGQRREQAPAPAPATQYTPGGYNGPDMPENL